MDDNAAPATEIANTSAPLTAEAAAAMLTRVQTANETPRAPDGKYAPRDAKPETSETDEKVVDLKTKQPVKAEEPATEEVEDEYFEFAPEKDGEEPRRVKVDEVLAAYEELPKLKSELETVKKTAPPPADYISAIEESVRERTKLVNGLQMLQQIIAPRDPSLELLNQASDKYDPDAYYAAKQHAEKARADIAALQAEQRKHADMQRQEEYALTRARMAREYHALLEVWPEFKTDEAKRDLMEGAKKLGFKEDEVNGITDHRHLLVLRDALKLRALEAEKAKAVQVVRQKPKLVKGAARTTTNPKAAAQSQAMERLRATGSMDAAAQALKGLI